MAQRLNQSALAGCPCCWSAQVRRWRTWEDSAAGRAQLYTIDSKLFFRRLGSNHWTHFFRAMVGQFSETVTEGVYYNVRRLFIERMGFEPDYDYHSLIVLSVEEQLRKTLQIEWLLWLAGAVFVTLPQPNYLAYWALGLDIAVSLLVGGHLASTGNIYLSTGAAPHAWPPPTCQCADV